MSFLQSPILTRALHQAAASHPQAAALRDEMDAQLDRELTADPQATTPDLIRRICNGFGVHIATEPGPGVRFLHETLETG